MKSELFDIVDENNKPLEIIKERSLAHRDGDWHRSVHIYVLNDKDEFLVHLRASFKDLRPNCWDTRFGGHVLAGDTVGHTAVKELEEEAGIKIEIKDLLKGVTYKWDGKTNREFNTVYFYKFKKGDVVKFNDNEVVEVKWMSFEEILKLLMNNPEKWATRASTVQKIYKYWKKLKNS